MKKNNFLIFCIIINMSLFGCRKEASIEVWIATREISVYKSPIGDGQDLVFKLSAGDVCIPGKESIEKVFKYTEVLCPKLGYGWVIDSQYFTVVTQQPPAEAGGLKVRTESP